MNFFRKVSESGSAMDEQQMVASPSNFRRTQSCRVAKGVNGLSRKTSRSGARSKSTRRTSGSTLASLSFSQRQALAVSWRLIRPQANGLFRKVFLELEIACPKVKQIFYKAALVDAFNKDNECCAGTIDEHVKLTSKFFDELLSLMDTEDEFRALIRRMGSCHAVLARSCNFTADIWERLGEIVMERVCTLDACASRESSRAWRTFIACVIDEMRSGFEEEQRLVGRRSSSASDIAEDLLVEEGAPASPGELTCPYGGGGSARDVSELQAQLRQLRMHYDNTLPLQ